MGPSTCSTATGAAANARCAKSHAASSPIQRKGHPPSVNASYDDKITPVPELPDVQVYIEHLERRLVGKTLVRVRLLNPFILRTAVPPIASAEGRKVLGVRRIGKRIVLELE